MADENFSWDDYYQKGQGRQPRQLLFDVLDKFPSQAALQAIDLGCGDGTETVFLLARGWQVLAIDGEEAAIKSLMQKVPKAAQIHLRTQVGKFEDVALPPADLIHASYSIPFCHPVQFAAFWERIVRAVKPGGRFAGQFFGVRDSWANKPHMTFHTEGQVRSMLEDFEIEFFHEEDEDGEASTGPKHWHVFTVIAKKS